MDLGASLRAAREAAGLSLSALSRQTHYSKALLGHLETGKRAVKPEHVTAYSRALSVSVEALYGQPDDPLRVAHEWLVAEHPGSIHRSVGRRIGTALVSELEARVIELRYLDDVIGGRDLFPLVRRELASAVALADTASYREATGKRLLTVVGELAQLAGWVASDAGEHIEAQHLYLSGVNAARGAGDSALTGQLLSSLSYQMANVGNPADASLLARSAVKGADNATPLVRGLLLERVAWASARARDHDMAARALDTVDDTYESRSVGDSEPHWVYWLDRAEINVMRARCLIELGNPAIAEPLLTTAVNGYAPNHAREAALYGTWLAEAYARSGVFDAARSALARARRAAKRVHSTRLDTRIATIDRLIDTV